MAQQSAAKAEWYGLKLFDKRRVIPMCSQILQEQIDQAFAEKIREEVLERSADRLRRYKRVEMLAYKWFDGEIDDKRMAEAVFGIVNEEAQR